MRHIKASHEDKGFHVLRLDQSVPPEMADDHEAKGVAHAIIAVLWVAGQTPPQILAVAMGKNNMHQESGRSPWCDRIHPGGDSPTTGKGNPFKARARRVQQIGERSG